MTSSFAARWGVALLFGLAAWTCCMAQSLPKATEHQLKAAFLYKFANYIEWPAHTFAADDSPIVIGVVGAEPLARELSSTVASRTVNGRRLLVRGLQVDDPLEGLHILFIGRSQGERAGEIITASRGMSMLVVTESEIAFALGSAINFVVVDGKVRFDVAVPPAETADVKISSRLLTVARKVVTSKGRSGALGRDPQYARAGPRSRWISGRLPGAAAVAVSTEARTAPAPWRSAG